MNATEERTFAEVLEDLMASRGVESLEELHERVVEAGHGYIPVPGRHRGKPVPLEEFKLHARGEYPRLYVEFLQGLYEVLDLSEDEALSLLRASAWGHIYRA